MERVNSEGILRKDLLMHLKDGRAVRTAVRFNTCFLCLRSGVNEAGLCDVCYGGLDGEEARLASRWMSGQGPE